MSTLAQLFEQFVRERTYVQNVTPRTCDWYRGAFTAYSRAHAGAPAKAPTDPLISRRDLQEFVIHLRERGLKPISCNCWLRAMNSFCRWLHEQGATTTLVTCRYNGWRSGSSTRSMTPPCGRS